jgi:glycylpeptide N-tetradecanoyltransferase
MLEKIQEMAPLFKPHAFWDTQPVQKGFEHFNAKVSNYKLYCQNLVENNLI